MSLSTEHKPYSAPTKTIHFWAVGAIADYPMYAMFALIPQFFTMSLGMSPFWVSTALIIPRVFDAFADPIIGHFSDNTHTRWGRRRPYLFVSAIIGALLIMGMWWMSKDWSFWPQFIWVLATSLLLFLCWGAYTMNHQALGYELSDDYHMRTKVIAVRGFYFACAATTGSYYYWFATLKEVPRDYILFKAHDIGSYLGILNTPTYQWLAKVKMFPNAVVGMRYESVGIAAAAFLAAMFMISTSKERFQRANRKHVDMLSAIKATMTVKPFMILIMLRIIASMGAGLVGGVLGYIGVYSVCRGDLHLYQSLPIWNGWIGLAMAGTLIFVAAKLSKFLGKRRGLIMSYGVGFVSACALPLMAQPGHPYLLLTHMIIFGPILATLLNVFQGAVMPDICDIDELQSGERREGLFSAVGSFISKIENSILAFASGSIVTLSGFNAKHAAADPPIPQTPDVIEHLRWLGFVPAIIFAGIVFSLSFLYPVTEKRMADVRAQLDERRQSGKAQEGLAEPAS